MKKISLETILKNSRDVISKEELSQKLKAKKKLRIKAGFDPSHPDLHLGHLVLLEKLKMFQDLGHEVFFLVGDFTARIGDPSGQDQARPPLSESQILKNQKTYKDQVFKILDKKKTKMVFNSKWMESFSSKKWIELSSLHTVARMLERDDFSKRYKARRPIYIHEFLYPLIQGYDSVEIKADIEIGGSDQIFNLLMGRELQKHFGMKPQSIITYPLLEGLDGQKKMSKSFRNTVSLQENPGEIYGKIMSISDTLLPQWFGLLLEGEEKSPDPYTAKKHLAFRMAAKLYSKKQAEQAQSEFFKVFKEKVLPENIEEQSFPPQREGILTARLLKDLNLAPSTGEGRRLIQNGGVRINEKKILSPDFKLTMNKGDEFLVQVGKRRFLKVRVK